MAVRPYWKGYLKLSLVTCPITLTPATTEGEKVKFHTLNRTTKDRIYTEYVDSVTGKTVDKTDQAKGYQRGDEDYVILEEEDLEAVQLESTKTIDIGEFVPADSVEWTYFDSPYFVIPDAEISEVAYSVIRQAMANKGVVGLARLVIRGRERAVMLQPWDEGIVLWTLRFGDEVRDEEEYWEQVDERPIDKKMLSMVGKLIQDRTSKWSETMVEDPVHERLLEIIKSKKAHKPAKQIKAEDDDTEDAKSNNIIDLMAALKKSLAGKPGSSPRKKQGG